MVHGDLNSGVFPLDTIIHVWSCTVTARNTFVEVEK